MGFETLLDVDLKLTIDGTDHKVDSSQVKHVSLDMFPWGFDAEVVFLVSQRRQDDSLFASFNVKKLIKAELSIKQDLPDDDSDAPDALVVKGYVTAKSVTETVNEAMSGSPVLYRRYTVRFHDVAQVLWKQHHPIDLFVDQSFQKVVDTHKGDKITITMSDWSITQTTFPIHFLPLGAPDNKASFYDFLAWFVDTQNGVWTYDAKQDSYTLTATKSQDGTATALVALEVGSIDLEFPETPRSTKNVLNSYTTNATTTAITNDEAATGMRIDYLVRTTIDSEVTDRTTLETNRLVLREHEVLVGFQEYPSIKLLPGGLLNFSHAMFGTNIYVATKDYRIREIHIRADATESGPTAEDSSEAKLFSVDYRLRLELKTETYVPLPRYTAPTWPAFVEGLVLSETGDNGTDDGSTPPEETYQIYTDSNTSIDQYKIQIPLFKDENGKALVVVAPYEPTFFPGHFYFPAFKKERVLVAMGFRDARIVRYLEWRAGARLPADGQGNHLLLGKKDKDQTSISHVYTDSKPVLAIKRTKAKDTELFQFEEGKITIQVKENQDDGGS